MTPLVLLFVVVAPAAPVSEALTSTPVASKKGCTPIGPDDQIEFHFRNAAIQDIVIAISRAMCKNFILEGLNNKRRFDVLSPTPISRDAAWQAFLSLLAAHDLALARSGRYYRIISVQEGSRTPGKTVGTAGDTPDTRRLVTKLFRVHNQDQAKTIHGFLRAFSSKKAQLHIHGPSGLIIVTDYGTNLRRLEMILAEIDAPRTAAHVHITSLRYATADALVQKLNQVFALGKGKPGQSSGGITTIIPDARTNRVLVIATRQAFEQVMDVVRRLDIPGEVDDGDIRVVKLRHAKAEDLANTLTGLLKSQGRSKGKGAPSGLLSGNIRVQADVATNSLLVTASRAEFTALERVIEKLDIRRLQVFVEAAILEVSVSDNREVGVSWHGGALGGAGSDASPVLVGSAPKKGVSSVLAAVKPASLLGTQGLSALLAGPLIGGKNGFPAFGALLQALAASDDVNIVATPHLLTMDNELAEIRVTEKIPFSSGTTLGPALAAAQGANAGPLGDLSAFGSVNITREEIGLKLKIKAQINDDSSLRLEIDQELSEVGAKDETTLQYKTTQRTAKSVVSVTDQETVVIGGLMQEIEATSHSKVPILGDLPLLGILFRTENRQRRKKNLIIVVTPHIVRNDDDFRRIHERKMEERREFMDFYYGDTPEYRAAIDWSRKVGPLAKFRQLIQQEARRIENGGSGEVDEVVIDAEAFRDPS